MKATAQQPTFAEHVSELRRRLIIVVLVLFAAASVAYVFRQPLIDIITKPLNQSLFYSSPGGGFNFVMQLSVTVGLLFAVPALTYHLAQFVTPAFERSKLKRRHTILIVIAASILAALGVLFAFLVMLPQSLHFFAGFNTGAVKPLISANEYLNFVLGASITFALLFQLPLLLLFINSMTRFPPGTLKKYRRHVIIGSLAFALVLPFTYDPLTQFIIALPVVVMFEISVISIWLVNRRHHKRAKRAAQPVADTKPIVEEKSVDLRPAAAPQPVMITVKEQVSVLKPTPSFNVTAPNLIDGGVGTLASRRSRYATRQVTSPRTRPTNTKVWRGTLDAVLPTRPVNTPNPTRLNPDRGYVNRGFVT